MVAAKNQNAAGLLDQVADGYRDALQRPRRVNNPPSTHRSGSTSSIAQQDRLLQIYRDWVKTHIPLARYEQNISKLDALCFPIPQQGDTPFAALFDQLQKFLDWAIPTHAACLEGVISYHSIVHWERVFQFWIHRKYLESGFEPPGYRQVHCAVVKSARHLHSKRTIRSVPPSIRPSTPISDQQLLRIMEADARSTDCIELAECHHLAWTFARSAHFQPGYLGPHQDVDWSVDTIPFLAWRDVHLERTDDTGGLMAKITVRNTDTDSVDPRRKSPPRDAYIFSFPSPAGTGVLGLSVAHRILGIAIRRGALKYIPTSEELYTDNRMFISVKPEFLDKPVLVVGATPSVGTNRALPSEDIEDHLSSRATKAGFAGPITFASIEDRTGGQPDPPRGSFLYIPTNKLISLTKRLILIDQAAVSLAQDDPREPEHLREMAAANRLYQELLDDVGSAVLQLDENLRRTGYGHRGDDAASAARHRMLCRAALREIMSNVSLEDVGELTVVEANAHRDALRQILASGELKQRILGRAGRDMIGSETQD